jgi:hypothetical protein
MSFCWLLVIGYWLLVIGYWLLVIGYWLLVIDLLVYWFIGLLVYWLFSTHDDCHLNQLTCCAPTSSPPEINFPLARLLVRLTGSTNRIALWGMTHGISFCAACRFRWLLVTGCWLLSE